MQDSTIQHYVYLVKFFVHHFSSGESYSFTCNGTKNVYSTCTMPRGKKTVFTMTCTVDACNQRVGTVRLLKQQPSKNRSWKDYSFEKYCNNCQKRVPVKLKEERHSK